MRKRSSSGLFMIISGIILLALTLTFPALAYIGDMNHDGLINHDDLNMIKNAFGSNNLAPNWNPYADITIDGKVDVADLAVAGRSYNSPYSFQVARRLSNQNQNVIKMSAAKDSLDRVHIAWSESGTVFYTRLDRYGNTLVDDLLLDSGSNVGDTGLSIGVDPEGNAQIVWDCSIGTCTSGIDKWGNQLQSKTRIDTVAPIIDPGVGIDSQGRVHIFYTNYGTNQQEYVVLSNQGKVALRSEGLLKFPDTTSRFLNLKIDANDSVHLLRAETVGTDTIYYSRIPTGSSMQYSEIAIGVPNWGTSISSVQRPALAVTPNGEAFILWNNYGSTSLPKQLFYNHVTSQGVVDVNNLAIWPEWDFGSYGSATTDLAVDQSNQMHVFSFTDFGHSSTHGAYGSFDANGVPLYPMRWVIYDAPPSKPLIFVDHDNQPMLVYYGGTGDSGYPPCTSGKLCFQGTAFSSAAYDFSRPDLGVDLAHISWDPLTARWNQTITIEGKIFNEGWAASNATTALVRLQLPSGDFLGGAAQAEVNIPSLAPGATADFSATLPLPFTPPAGTEDMTYLRLQVWVDPAESVLETTEDNNLADSPILVQPLPTTAGLYLVVEDETLSARSGPNLPLNVGQAVLSGNGDDQTIEVSEYITVLGKTLPIDKTYAVSWSSSGYALPSPSSASISRSLIDPYDILYSPDPPGNTVLLATNRWATLSGTIRESVTHTALVDANIHIQGEGLDFFVTSDSQGQFSATADPRLGKIIPGQYNLTLTHPGHERLSEKVTIAALSDVDLQKEMNTTIYAYVRGTVVNGFENPVPNAAVNACGATTTTASNGTFDLGDVDAACTTLTVTHTGYAAYSEPLSLTVGLEMITLSQLVFDPAVSVAQSQGGIASWYQDVDSESLLPDAPDDASFLEKQIFSKFSDEFWPSYRVQVWYACYDYYVDATFTGPLDDRRLYQFQTRLVPRTFNAHRVSGEGEVELSGHSIGVEIGMFQDSGMQTALFVVEARLVDADSGQIIKQVRSTIEGNSTWVALEDATRTYDFEAVKIDDWSNAELWLYLKAGYNDNGSWHDSLILEGWHFDTQVLRFKLSSEDAFGDYVTVNFPLP